MVISLLFKVFSQSILLLNKIENAPIPCHQMKMNAFACHKAKNVQARCYCKLMLVADPVRDFFLCNFSFFLSFSMLVPLISESKWGWWWAFQQVHHGPCCSNQSVGSFRVGIALWSKVHQGAQSSL